MRICCAIIILSVPNCISSTSDCEKSQLQSDAKVAGIHEHAGALMTSSQRTGLISRPPTKAVAIVWVSASISAPGTHPYTHLRPGAAREHKLRLQHLNDLRPPPHPSRIALRSNFVVNA